MGIGRKLINKMKRRRKALNPNRGFRQQDKADRRDEVLAGSPSAYKAMRHVTRRLDRSFGQQNSPSPQKASQEMLMLVELVGVDSVEGVAAFFTGQVAGMTTDVTIVADNEGTAGNSVSLPFDGTDDIDTAISDWNLANPGNTVTLTDGDGSQIPDNLETIDLAGGVDEVIGTLDMEMASGTMRAVGLKAGDIVMILEGDLKGKQATVLTVDYGADTAELEPQVGLDGTESDQAVKLQLSGVKKSYK